jgi:hypothetical protein
MRYRAIVPAFVLTAALTVTGCGTDDTADTYDDTLPPATETTTPAATTPGAYDGGMTADTAWGADTLGTGMGMDTTPGM